MIDVNEKSTAYLTATFKDKGGNLQAPASLTYRVDDMTSGAVVRNDTALTPASAVEVTLTPTDNAMQIAGNAREVRRVTFKATYGASDAVNAQYDYTVVNLTGVT